MCIARTEMKEWEKNQGRGKNPNEPLLSVKYDPSRGDLGQRGNPGYVVTPPY